MYNTLAFLLSFATISSVSSNDYECSSGDPSDQPIYIPHFDYVEMSYNESFIDKTMLLRTILDGPRMKLITAPSLFGKTMNLAMIRAFLELKLDRNGSVIDANKTEIHDAFKNLIIYKQHKDFFYKHYSQYPVFFINLKSDYNELLKIADAVEMFRRKVHKAFIDHAYLMFSKRLNKEQKKMCRLWHNYPSYNDFNVTEIEKGLVRLVEYMRIHFNKKILVIIDEYDNMIMHALFTTEASPINDITKYVTGHVTALCRAVEYVEYAIVTGVSYIVSGGFFKSDDIQAYKFLDDHPYASFFGATEPEVNKLFEDPRFGLDKANRTEGRMYFDGYFSKSGLKIFNIYSVLMYTEFRRLTNYWSSCGYHVNVMKNVFLQKPTLEIIKKLLDFNFVPIQLLDEVRPEHLAEVRNIYFVNSTLINQDVLFSHLLEIGYLTYVPDGTNHGSKSLLRIPCLEIEQAFLREVSMMYEFDYVREFKRMMYNISGEIKNKFKDEKFCQWVQKYYEYDEEGIVKKGLYFSLFNKLFRKFRISLFPRQKKKS